MKRRKYSYELCADLNFEESKPNDLLKTNREKYFYDDNNNKAMHIFDSIEFPINRRGINDIWRSNEYNSGKDYEWSSRGNISIEYSQKLCVSKRELYRSCTPIISEKNNLSKLERIEIKNKSEGPKKPQIVHNKGIRDTTNPIEKYFCKRKYIGSRRISTDSQIIPPQVGLSSEPFNKLEKLHTSSIANRDDSAYLQSDSQFNINVALQLSSRIHNVKASEIKSEEIISENIPIKRYIHEKPYSEKGRVSTNWISLNLFQQRSVNKKSNKSSYSTIKGQPEEYSCLISTNKNSTSTQAENYNIFRKNELLHKSVESDWTSRGFKNNISSTHTPKRHIKCKKSPIKNEKRRQSSLYDCFIRKDKSIMKQRNNWNDNKKFDYIFSSKEQHVDDYYKNKIVCKLDDQIGHLPEKIAENIGSDDIYDKDISENNFPLSIEESKELENIPLELGSINQFQSNIFDKQIYKNGKIDYSDIPSSSNRNVNDGRIEISDHNLISRAASFNKTISNLNFPNQQHEKDINNSELYSCSSAVVNMETHSEEDQSALLLNDRESDNSKILPMPFENEEAKLISPTVCTEDQNENISINMHNPVVSNGIDRHNEEIASSNSKSVELFLCQNSNTIKSPFSKVDYNTLQVVSSPLLTDPECQAYLKTLVDENNKQEIKDYGKSIHIAKNTSNQSDSCLIPDEVCLNNQTDSEEYNFLHFWENMLSQNHLGYSQTNESSSLTQNDCHGIEKISQKGSEIFQYILSPDCAESDSLLNNVEKNMNNFSTKIMQKISLVFNSNKNANKILRLALTIYAQHKERSILSKSQSSETTTSSKLRVGKKCDGSVWIYTIIRILDVDGSKSDNYITENEKMCSWTPDVSIRSVSEADRKILLGLEEICLNTSYLYVENDDATCNMLNSRFDIINKIKTIFENVLNDFNTNKSPCLEIRRQTFEECMIINGRLELKSEENCKMIKVKYQNTSSQFKFCIMMYILAKVLQILESNSKTTRRELYYQIKHLISNQSHIDRAVKAISCMLSVGPWNLNIVAHKGMVFGDLKITISSNEIVDCNLPGTLIPQDVDEISELRSSAFFILVVEKESIFYKILEENFPNKLVRPFLMITGKGFPDLNTQLFLKKLWMVMSVPIFIFSDADPHGINIMMTYRFGSLANAHLSQQLAIPKAQWLGVFPSEVVRLNADKQILTEIEKNVIKNMLRTPYMKINRKIEEELKFMLESGYKAGIEGIIKNHTFLSEFYFPLKFHNKDLI